MCTEAVPGRGACQEVGAMEGQSSFKGVSKSCRLLRGGGTGQMPIPTAKWAMNAAQSSR